MSEKREATMNKRVAFAAVSLSAFGLIGAACGSTSHASSPGVKTQAPITQSPSTPAAQTPTTSAPVVTTPPPPTPLEQMKKTWYAQSSDHWNDLTASLKSVPSSEASNMLAYRAACTAIAQHANDLGSHNVPVIPLQLPYQTFLDDMAMGGVQCVDAISNNDYSEFQQAVGSFLKAQDDLTKFNSLASTYVPSWTSIADLGD